MNHLKTRAHDFGVDNLKHVPVDLNEVNEVNEKTKNNSLKTQVNEILDTTTLININQ